MRKRHMVLVALNGSSAGDLLHKIDRSKRPHTARPPMSRGIVTAAFYMVRSMNFCSCFSVLPKRPEMTIIRLKYWPTIPSSTIPIAPCS
jgi:hypothetical protein